MTGIVLFFSALVPVFYNINFIDMLLLTNLGLKLSVLKNIKQWIIYKTFLVIFYNFKKREKGIAVFIKLLFFLFVYLLIMGLLQTWVYAFSITGIMVANRKIF